MLSKAKIQGFKCFDSEELCFGNLTLFTGVNSAGKSSALQALLLLLQQENNGRSVLNGKYIRLGQMKEIRNWLTNSKQICVEAEIDQKTTGICIDIDKKESVQLENVDVIQSCDLIYLSAERIGAEDVYKQNLMHEYRIGVHGEYTFDYLSTNKLDELREPAFAVDATSVNLGNQVDYWLNKIMGYFVTAEQISGTEIVKVSYRRGESGSRELQPRHVGTGVSYVASVITAALSCKKGSIFIVENPEIHLHPGAQSKLLEFFCYLAEKGLQIIIETHSDHIFNGVRKNIKKGAVSLEQTKIYYFIQNENHFSKPVMIKVDENGVIKNHKKGLFDQFDDDLDELLGL